jgi:hypothetical protein
MHGRRLSAATVFRAIARTGTVLCLLLAALELAVGVSEYPGYTWAALRYMTSEVLSLLVVGLVTLAALDAAPDRARGVGLLALAAGIDLLAHALPAVTTGAAPYAFLLAGVAAMLVLGTLGMAIVHSWKRGQNAALGINEP